MAWVFSLFFYSFSNAQVPDGVQSTPNLIQPYGWQGCLTQYAGSIWGGTSGGPCPVQRSADGAILWSYGQGTLSQTIAVNQALSGTGIQVRGYNYNWQIKNANAGGGQAQPYDPLTITTNLYDTTNKTVLETKTHDYSYRINDWTTFSGTEEFNNRYSLASVGNFTVTMTSRDMGYWAGYYGPEIRNINVSLRYGVDMCAANPLSSPDCPGYAEAYRQQQCSLNALFSPECPGYAQAYLQQQCVINPLYNSSCPGYAQAFFQYQCSANPLYNALCPGYAQAFFNEQCKANPLYNAQCPGYAQAFYNEQCKVSALYDKGCPGYAQAYFTEQCRLNPLYDRTCVGYDQAYFNLQCSLNTLYNAQCPGYAQAFYNEQCRINPLYDRGCPNYEAAFLAQQCTANTLYSPQCPGYAAAYQQKVFNDACSSNPQSSPKCPNYKPVEVAVTPASVAVASAFQDVATAPAQVSLVADPVVNQSISAPSEQTVRNRESTNAGQGLLVPGFNTGPAPQQPSRSTARENARRDAMQTATRAEQQTMSNEQRQQQETLNQIASVPGFDAYSNAVIPDAPFYASREIYRGVIIRDNARAQRALSQRSDRLHQEMVNDQYR